MNTQEVYAKRLTEHARIKLSPKDFVRVMEEVQTQRPRDAFSYTDALKGAVTKINPKMVGALFDIDYRSRKDITR